MEMNYQPVNFGSTLSLEKKDARRTRFELVRENPNGFLNHRLNRSAIGASTNVEGNILNKLALNMFVEICCLIPRSTTLGSGEILFQTSEANWILQHLLWLTN